MIVFPFGVRTDAADIVFAVAQCHDLSLFRIFGRDLQTVRKILFRYGPRVVAPRTETGFQAGKQRLFRLYPDIGTNPVVHVRQVDKRRPESLAYRLFSETYP